MPLPKDQVWFPMKTYGWGWGFPCRWQGWVVLAGFVGAMIAGSPLVGKAPFAYVGYGFSLLGVLIVICWIKGERPRWRWGGRE